MGEHHKQFVTVTSNMELAPVPGFAANIRVLTQELHLPLPHALHLHGVEVRQVVVLVPQGVLLQAEGGQAPRGIPTRENAVRTV